MRQQAIEELRAIKKNTNSEAVVLMVGANDNFDWPVPKTEEIQKIVSFINDARLEGLRVILFVSTPCIIPNSVVPANYKYKHVGGHKKGEIVNNIPLYWDVDYCENNNIELAINWYKQIISGLEAGLNSIDSIALLEVSGQPFLPFTTEINAFHDGFEFLSDAQNYVKAVIPALNNFTKIPIGVSLLPSNWSTEENFRYSSLVNFLNVVNINDIDYIDLTSNVWIKPEAILNRVGWGNSRKIILSDFQYSNTATDDKFGEPYNYPTQYDKTKFHLDAVKKYGFGGWWLWEYKDNSNENYLGIRQEGFKGMDGGWKKDITDLIQADVVSK